MEQYCSTPNCFFRRQYAYASSSPLLEVRIRYTIKFARRLFFQSKEIRGFFWEMIFQKSTVHLPTYKDIFAAPDYYVPQLQQHHMLNFFIVKAFCII